jgi:hypothetical protein
MSGGSCAADYISYNYVFRTLIHAGVDRRHSANCEAQHAVLLGSVSAERHQQISRLEFPIMGLSRCYRVGVLYCLLFKPSG